jgi:molecular chaperone GrpE (heat shock protein)
MGKKGNIEMRKKKKRGKATVINEEVELLKGQLVRTLADYDNLQKRVEREKGEFLKYSNQALIERLLPIIDMLEQAQCHLKDSGLAIAINEFKELLREGGVEEIRAEEEDEFNEELFEAVEAIDLPTGGNIKKVAAGPEGRVAEMLLSGYKFIDGPVIRPVKVKVFRS